MGWRMAAAASLLLLTLGMGVWGREIVRDHCREMEALMARVQTGDSESAPLDEAVGLWEERLPLLSSLLNHEVLEQVGTCLSRAKGCLSAGDGAGCKEQLEAALYLLDDIREYDDISWKNLF